MASLAAHLTQVSDIQSAKDLELIDEAAKDAASLQKPRRHLPAMLHRRSTRRRSVYTSHYVLLAVDFTGNTFRIVWMLTLAARLSCILFLGWTTRLYWFITHPYMSYYSSLMGQSAVANFKPMGLVFGFVATLHAYQVFQMVRYSIYYRALVLGPPPRSLGPNGDSLCFRDWHSRFRSSRVFLWTLKRDFRRFFFDRHGPFGVESSLFHLRFLVNELVEIISQTTQVYNASLLVSKVWLNNVYVTVTVLNCWSTPFLRFLFYKLSNAISTTAALERVVTLSVDFVLDSTSAMVLPLLLFMPYYERFDFGFFSFTAADLYDDIWFTNMVRENQQLLAQTNWDFVWKLVPHLSIYGGLNSIRALIRPPRVHRTRVHVSGEPVQLRDAKSEKLPALVETKSPGDPVGHSPPVAAIPKVVAKGDNNHDRSVSLPPIPEAKSLQRSSSGVISRHLTFLTNWTGRLTHEQGPGRRVLQNAMQLILVIAGLVLLVLHLQAAWKAYDTRVVSCSSQTRPWFAAKVSCSVVRHNCHMHNASGVTDADLAMIEPDSVGALVLSHCPEMHVPTIVASFRNLLGIELYNCTLYEWSVEAAITAEAHPHLTYIVLAFVNMTRFPDGILQSLPKTMTDFELVGSNFTELPLNLHELWPPMSAFFFERSPIIEFPPALMLLHVDDLSLMYTQIEKLPEFPPTVSFMALSMTHTPLRELPESIGDMQSLGFLNLGYTQVERLPRWVNDLAKTANNIFLHHTPFCASKSEQEIVVDYGVAAVLSCLDDLDVRQNGKYPLAIVAPLRLYDDPEMMPTILTTETEFETSQVAVEDQYELRLAPQHH